MIKFITALFLLASNHSFASDTDYIGIVEKNSTNNCNARIMFKRKISTGIFKAMPNNPKDAAELDSIIENYPETFVGVYFDNESNDFKPINSQKPFKYEGFSDVGCYETNVEYNYTGPFLLSDSKRNRKISFKEINTDDDFNYLIQNIPELKNVNDIASDKQYLHERKLRKYKIVNPKYEIIIGTLGSMPVSPELNEKITSFVVIKKDNKYSFSFEHSNVYHINLLFALDYDSNNKINLLFKSESDEDTIYTLYDTFKNNSENFIYEKF